MTKVRNLAFLSAILGLTFTLNITYAENCTVTVPSPNINLNLATTKLTTYVFFRQCINSVKPSFQWGNTTGSTGAFYLNNQSKTTIPVPVNAQIGGSWDNSFPNTSAFTSASRASTNFDHRFSLSDTPKNLTLYTEFSLADFGDLSKYPAGTYKTSLVFSANEF